jgi:hypothetical protein
MAGVVRRIYVARKLDGHTFDARVPQDQFDRMMLSAARHPGYGASADAFSEAAWRDLRLECRGDGDVRVRRRAVTSAAHEGGLLTVEYKEAAAPMDAWPCQLEPHADRRVTRLLLRMHARAHLVFETAGDVRQAYIEVQSPDDADPDLRRVVANTAQVVLMAAPPLRAKK